MTPHDVPYFVDNGAYSGKFDMDEWLDTLEKAKTEMPRWPDFIVWPDVHGDAEATRELCESLFHRDAPLLPRRQDFNRYVAFQPGLSIDELFEFATDMLADGIFVGGSKRWKRAHGPEIVARAHDEGLQVHVGNPGGEDGLVWAYQTGFDSADTTTVFQNEYWHYLERLEEATEETQTPTQDTCQLELTESVEVV
ncbi:hypothetical protein [Halorussus salinus]|uniref:hypothetical protein n=1 Tax=Halorussus salinus TaxID=1364935 RepID=UPI00192F17F9|nr:hypothetical protein [Halorussus salinus]